MKKIVVLDLQRVKHLQDCLLHVLPLHHTHGIVNCLLCPLAVGGRVQMLENFEAAKVWKCLLSEEKSESRYWYFLVNHTHSLETSKSTCLFCKFKLSFKNPKLHDTNHCQYWSGANPDKLRFYLFSEFRCWDRAFVLKNETNILFTMS